MIDDRGWPHAPQWPDRPQQFLYGLIVAIALGLIGIVVLAWVA